MQEEKKAETYEKIIEYQEKLHEKNQERIRIGIRIVLIIPLIFLLIMFSLKSSKVVFLVLWIVSMFAISIYLIMVEYADYKIQVQLQEWGLSNETEIKNLIDNKLVVEKVIENSGILEEVPQMAQLPLYENSQGQTMKLDELPDTQETYDEEAYDEEFYDDEAYNETYDDDAYDEQMVSEEEFAEEVEQILTSEKMTNVSEKNRRPVNSDAVKKKVTPSAGVIQQQKAAVEPKARPQRIQQAQPEKREVPERVKPVPEVHRSRSLLYSESDYEIEEAYNNDYYDDYYEDNIYYDNHFNETYQENDTDVIYEEKGASVEMAEEELVQSIRKYVHALSSQVGDGGNAMIQMKTPQDYAQMRREKARERRDY